MIVINQYRIGVTVNGVSFFYDLCDLSIVLNNKWYVTKQGYITRCGHFKKKGEHTLLHRLIMDAPNGSMIDHINGDKTDNRRCNLRFCTNQQNQMNMRSKRGASRYKGVSKSRHHWKASIHIGSKNVHLGVFDSEEEAGRAYDRKALEVYGEFACLNFNKEDYQECQQLNLFI